jgi:hypothetical protein
MITASSSHTSMVVSGFASQALADAAASAMVTQFGGSNAVNTLVVQTA